MADLILQHGKNFFQEDHTTKICFNKEDFYKMIVSEINLFQTKRFHQHENLKSNYLSPNWEFVTLYYEFFFTSFVFLLFLHRGFVFFPQEKAKAIETLLQNCTSELYTFPQGNYFFWVNEKDIGADTIIVSFTKSGNNTHEALWKRIPEVLRKDIQSKANTTELSVYENLKNATDAYGEAFPSQTRNHFNYTAISAYNNIEKLIFFTYRHSKDLIKDFLSTTFTKDDSWEQKALVTQYYHEIINTLTDLLYKEYIDRGNEKCDFYKYYQTIPKKASAQQGNT